jgi:hypothetical protein
MRLRIAFLIVSHSKSDARTRAHSKSCAKRVTLLYIRHCHGQNLVFVLLL